MNKTALFLLSRLGIIVSVLLGAATIAFIAVKSIPGDPVDILAGGQNIVDAEQREYVRQQYGLDKPLIVQYFAYMAKALTGDFGQSYIYRQDVVDVLAQAFPATAQLAVSAVAIAFLLAVVNAVITAGRGGPLRTIISSIELVLLSTPVFWIGIILLTFLSFRLGLFPVAGNSGIKSLILPVITLALPQTARLSQVLRDGLEQSLDQPFTLTVRTRGVGETMLRLKHGVRHSLLALSTLAGTMLAEVLGGAVVAETVFGRTGIGQIVLRAISSRDMPLVLGVVMLAALIAVVINLLIDTSYRFIDPRLRKAV